MTSDDDRLAPITPLFRGKPGGGLDDALQRAVSRHPAGTGRGDRQAAGATPRPRAQAADVDESHSNPPAATSHEGWHSGRPGSDEDPASAVPEIDVPPTLRALPTYAAFAATTESSGDETAEAPRGREPSAHVRDIPDTRSPAERRTDARIAARKRAEDTRVRMTGDGSASIPARRGSKATDPGVPGAEVSDLGGYDAERSETERSETEASDAEGAVPETLEAAKQRAENISLHALSRRGVSSVEMARILTSRDLPDEVVALEIERLERVGLLDDIELAENLVRSKQERKGLGKGAITAELRQRGVAQEAIEAAMADIDDDDEQARCDEWAAKRVGQLRGLDHAAAERRLTGYLMRRGYRSDVIRRSIETVLPKNGSGGGVRFR